MTEILSMPFVQRAILAGIMVGFLAGYYGVFIVQRKMSFIGSGLAHSAFGGVALGLLLSTEPLIIAVPFTILVSFLITWLKAKTELSADTSVGVLFALSMALGIIFLSIKQGYSADAFNYLFGSILSVMPSDLWVTALIVVISIFTGYRLWSRWAYATFDTELARADKINVLRHDYILSVMLAVTIVVSVKLVGIILITAYLVIPAATAKMLSNTFYRMTWLSVLIGITSSIIGLIISFSVDLPTGAVIIIIQTVLFVIAMFLSKLLKQG